MTEQEIDKNIFKFDKNVKALSVEHWAYRVLLAAPEVGPFITQEDVVQKICSFYGTRAARVQTMCRRLAVNKIIRYGKRNQKLFLDGEIYSDGTGLALGACIARGLIRGAKNTDSHQRTNK